MTRLHPVMLPAALGLVLWSGQSTAQTVATPPTTTPQTPSVVRVDAQIAQALLANPMTAPYRLTIAVNNGRVVLRGRIGGRRSSRRRFSWWPCSLRLTFRSMGCTVHLYWLH